MEQALRTLAAPCFLALLTGRALGACVAPEEDPPAPMDISFFRGHFSVFRVTADKLIASDVAWTPVNEGNDPALAGWFFEREF